MSPKDATRCAGCGGVAQAATTTYSVDTGDTLIVVRTVPALVCEACGEEWIDDRTADALERIVAEARRKGTQVEIVAMERALA